MCGERVIEYVGISDVHSLNRSWLVKKAFDEVCRSLDMIDLRLDTRTYIPVQYLYCEELHYFFRIVGWKDRIQIEQLSCTLGEYIEICTQYAQYIIQYDPVTYYSIRKEEAEDFYSFWEKAFRIFIPSFDYREASSHPVNYLISFYPVQGRQCLLSLTTIFDLQYLFYSLPVNVPHFVVSLGGLPLAEFVERLIGLFKPCLQRTFLLYGFLDHYSEDALQYAPEEVRALAIGRNLLFEKLLVNARKAGVTVIDLCTDDDLLTCLKKGNEGYFIQLLTHYVRKKEGSEGRLFYQESSIRFDILVKLLQREKNAGTLREDLYIDAVTCTNFFDFRVFYELGFRYLYMSQHDFDTDQASLVLNEMYTGINAHRLGWDKNYLDGTKHFHEARSSVYRCFFALHRKKLAVYSPTINYMETTIEVQGELAKELRDFLEDQRLIEGSPYLEIKTKEIGRDVGTGKKMLLLESFIFLLVIGQDLLKDLVKDFLKDKIAKGGQHSAKYRLKSRDGRELEVTLNGLTLKEVEDMIKNFEGEIVDFSCERSGG